MKTREVETVTNNEDFVRLRIFDGELPADEATAELLRLEREQHEATRRKLNECMRRLDELRGS